LDIATDSTKQRVTILQKNCQHKVAIIYTQWITMNKRTMNLYTNQSTYGSDILRFCLMSLIFVKINVTLNSIYCATCTSVSKRGYQGTKQN